jgi:hypothetical protein
MSREDTTPPSESKKGEEEFKRIWIVGLSGLQREVILSGNCTSNKAFEVLHKAGADICDPQKVEYFILAYSDRADNFVVIADKDDLMEQLGQYRPSQVYYRCIKPNTGRQSDTRPQPLAQQNQNEAAVSRNGNGSERTGTVPSTC